MAKNVFSLQGLRIDAFFRKLLSQLKSRHLLLLCHNAFLALPDSPMKNFQCFYSLLEVPGGTDEEGARRKIMKDNFIPSVGK